MIIPEKPDFLNYSSDRVFHFFKLWELLIYENLNPVQVYDEELDTYVLDETNDFQCSLLATLMELDQSYKELVITEKGVVKQFFQNIIDQPSFWSNDHVRFRNFIIDWYSAQRSLVTKSRRSLDPYSMADDELNDLILSFGYPYPCDIVKSQKAIFLHNLIGYYQSKGTPKVLGDVLTFYGVVDAVICEWWLYHDPRSNVLWMKSQPVWPRTERHNEDYIYSTAYESFVRPDPHWYYNKDNSETDLLDLYNSTEDDSDELENKITLPSITPYISLNNSIKSSFINPELSILNRKVQESYEWWIEYILKWNGSYDTTSSFPSDPEVNWVVFCEETQTHFVYNGRGWVNLNIELPSYLVESEPECLGETEFTLERDIPLNIYTTSQYSLLEVMIALSYIFSIRFSMYAVREDSVATWEDLPTYGMVENEVRLVEDLGVDAIYCDGVWKSFDTTTGYSDTEGDLSLAFHIPNDNTTSDYFNVAHLEYDGENSPLDFIYDDQTSLEYTTLCRDNIDDVQYSDIQTEWNFWHTRPTDTPISTVDVGLDGLDQRPYYTARQKRKERLIQISDRFYRSMNSLHDSYELVKNFTQIEYPENVFDINEGWFWDSTGTKEITLQPETRGFEFSVKDTTEICFCQLTSLSDGLAKLQSFSGKFTLSFDCNLINSYNSNLIISGTNSLFLNPLGALITVSQSGHYSITTDKIDNLSTLIFLNQTGMEMSGVIRNLSFKLLVDNSDAEEFDLNIFFNETMGQLDSTEILDPCWFQTATSSEDAFIEIDLITKEMTIANWDITSASPQFGFFMYTPYRTQFYPECDLIFPRYSVDSTVSTDHWIQLSFEIYDYTGNEKLAFLVSSVGSDTTELVTNNLLLCNQEGIYRHIINIKDTQILIFTGQVLEEYSGQGYFKVKNIRVDEIDPPGGITQSSAHYSAYIRSKQFLEAMCPELKDAIDSSFYITGLLYPEDVGRFARIKEIFMQDLGFYLKNTLGLTHLLGLSNYVLGLSLYQEIKKIINFLKPFRVRFRSFMSELEFDDPVSDGQYVADEFLVPDMKMRLYDINNTTEQLTAAIVMLFEEGIYRYPSIDSFGNPAGGPGIHPFVFDGITRSLFDFFLQQIKIDFEDEVYFDDELLSSIDMDLIDDVQDSLSDEMEWGVGITHEDYYRDEIFDINVRENGYLDCYDVTTGFLFNKICFEEDPLEYDMVPEISAGILTEFSDYSHMSRGFYEIDATTGSPIELGTNWDIIDNVLISDSSSVNPLIYVFSPLNVDATTGEITTIGGFPSGFFKVSYDINVIDDGGSFFFLLFERETDTTSGSYLGNPDFTRIYSLSVGSNTITDDFKNQESHNGMQYCIFVGGPIASADPFTVEISNLQIKALSWDGQPNLIFDT